MIQWALKLAVVPTSVFGSPDVIVASTPPRTSLIAGLIVARRTGAPLVLDFRDDWTTNAYFATRLPWRRFLERRLEAACFAAARAIVVVSDVSAARYAATYPRAAGRISVIPNGFDPEDVPDGVDGNGRGGPLTLAHVGSLHLKRDPAAFLEGLAGFLARRPESEPAIRLRLIGPIGDWQRTMVEDLLPAGIASIEPFRPQRAALEEAARSDVLVVMTSAAEGSDATLPGKLYEYAAVGRPILVVGPEGPAAGMVSSNGLGVWGDVAVPGAVERAIEQAIALGRDPSFPGATDEFLARFDRRRQSERWSELLHRVARPRHRPAWPAPTAVKPRGAPR
jgi:glycosyltransferase involved in cell wall biosynthesis